MSIFPPPPGGGIFCVFVVASPNSISTTDTPTGGYGIRPYGLPIPLHSACRQLRRGGGTPPYILPKKGNVGRPALWPPCPLPATANLPCDPPHPHPADKSLPCQREVPSLRGGGIPARLRVRQCTRHSPSESLRPPAASTCSPSGATRHLPPARGSLSLTREAFLLQP